MILSLKGYIYLSREANIFLKLPLIYFTLLPQIFGALRLGLVYLLVGNQP